ncbi:MAG: hypothetical protein IRY99_11965 [Isosphaeraceae bacterium]|nr:hypothetical protein [Isosphaeraceae bacterium]
MRRSRRGGQFAPEFGSSGEDSFVAVVVTKLTGALLFILLLTMVIMALVPKGADTAAPSRSGEGSPPPLAITTPEVLPEAIAGRPYAVALAATGGRGPLRWAVDGELPEGLTFDAASGQLRGTPKAGTPRPVELILRVSDGTDRAARAARLVVYQAEGPLTLPNRYAPGLPPVPWRAWLEQGFGFLILLLVHMVGLNAIGALERWSAASIPAGDADAERALRCRFAWYRTLIRLATLGAVVALALWLWRAK